MKRQILVVLLCMLFVPAARCMGSDSGADPDPRTDRLCAEAAAPDDAPDKVHINCRLETGGFAPEPGTEAVSEIVVAAYNMERGMKLEEQIRLFKEGPDFRDADVLLVSEVDRGCTRTQYRNVARELARALGMNYVYGVEYMELPRKYKKTTDAIETICEHGNAVLSRYPITNYEQIRHAETKYWYIPPGPGRDNMEPRLGGTMAIAADIALPGRTLRVYAMHLDSDLDNADKRAAAAAELTAHAAETKGPVIMGGDCNTYTYLNDLLTGSHNDSAVQTFLNTGFMDAHAGIPAKKRGTTNSDYLVRAVIDLMFIRGADVMASGICPAKICDPLSDHLPIWSKIKLK